MHGAGKAGVFARRAYPGLNIFRVERRYDCLDKQDHSLGKLALSLPHNFNGKVTWEVN